MDASEIVQMAISAFGIIITLVLVWGNGERLKGVLEEKLKAITEKLDDAKKKFEHIDIRCEEQDDELLFIGWLSALLYEMDARNMLFSRFEVEMVGGGLQARAWGEQVDIRKHEPAVEVKAATYAALEVRRDDRGNWIAQCIVDV